jgi:hypothetical protein
MIGLLLWLLPGTVAAQAGVRESPALLALAGSVVARTGTPWYALSNPASLAGDTDIDILCAYSPSSIGIAGFVQGTMIATLPFDSLRCGALSAGATSVPGYREVYGSATIGLRSGSISFGAAISILSISIDRYGSAVAPTLDIGLLAALNDRTRLAGAVSNVTRERLADADLPQRLALGLAMDFGRTTISADVVQELHRSASVAIGLSFTPVPGSTINAGVGSYPEQISLGFSYNYHGIVIDYGGSYGVPLGFRHLFGAGVRL